MTRTVFTTLAASLVMTISGAAFAADPPAASTAAATPAPAHAAKKAKVESPNDLICKTDLTTGSRLDAVRTCMTRQQWAEQSQMNHDAMMGSHPQAYTPGR